jgi:biotin carboxyl carrier protein
MKRLLRSGESLKEVVLSTQGNKVQATLGDTNYEVTAEFLSDTELLLWKGNTPLRFAFSRQKNGDISLVRRGQSYTLRIEEGGRRRSQESESALSSPMPGKVIRVLKAAKDSVQKGEAILVIEAMKMELPIKASRPGIIKSVLCQLGERVAAGATLVELE